MADTRTAEQRLADLTLYGECPVCRAPRTVTRSEVPGGGIMLSLVCPHGCMMTEGDAHG